MDEYYGWMFDNSVGGLPEKAAAEGITPLEFMRKYGAVEVKKTNYGGRYNHPSSSTRSATGWPSVPARRWPP